MTVIAKTAVAVDEIVAVVEAAIEKHGASRDALIPILSQVNAAFGYIPAGAFPIVRRKLQLNDEQPYVAESQLFSLASFYHMLSTQPMGKHVIRFCESAPCHVMGGRELFGAVQETLSLQPGETSPDGMWSLITTSCLSVCGVGPVLLIDEDIYGNVTPDQVHGILARYD